MTKITTIFVCCMALCAGLLTSGCQKEDNISPIYNNHEVENDNTLVGSTWYFSNTGKLEGTNSSYSMLSKIYFENISQGSFTFSTDLMGINNHCPMTYILQEGEGCLLLQNADTLRFTLLDDYHMKVTLTPAAASVDSANLGIILNTNGGTMEAVYCRLEAERSSSLLGSKWTTTYSNYEMAGDYYNSISYTGRIDFDSEGGGILISYYHGTWNRQYVAPSYDSLRRPFILNDDGDGLRLLFYNGDTAFLRRAIVNHDTVLLLTPTVCALGLEQEDTRMLDLMTTEGAKQVWFNRPEDLLDDRGYGIITLPNSSAELFLLKRSVLKSNGSIYFSINGSTVPNSNVTHVIQLMLNSEMEAGSYTIGEDKRVTYFGLEEGRVTNGTLDITVINGGYRLDLTGVNQNNKKVKFFYQGQLNDYETVE